MTDPKIVTSGLSQRVTVEGHNLSIEIYKLEGTNEWCAFRSVRTAIPALSGHVYRYDPDVIRLFRIS